MTEKNRRRACPGRGMQARERGMEITPDHEPFAARVERLRRLLADLIARRLAEEQRQLTAKNGRD
jgi:hypothetical protein